MTAAGVVADRLFAAIEAGDIEAVRALYSPAIVVWHNGDKTGQNAESNLRLLQWLTKHVTDLRYEEVVRHEFDSGFVQQHVLRATTATGAPLEVPSCLVVAVEGEQITRIDEYLDSTHLAPLRG